MHENVLCTDHLNYINKLSYHLKKLDQKINYEKQNNFYDYIAVCHDQNIDRRIIQQCISLARVGYEGLIIALSNHGDDELDQIEDNGFKISVHRIGLDRIAPDCPIYYDYINNIEKFKNKPRLLNINNFIYKVKLLLKYRSTNIFHPHPFDYCFGTTLQLYKCRLIIAHDLPALKSCAHVSNQMRVPLIYDSHELYSEQAAFSKPQKKLLDALEAKYIKYCKHVITVSDSFAKIIYKKNKLHLMPHVIRNVADFNYDNLDVNEDEVNDIRTLANLPIDSKVILFQGGVSHNRNLHNLLLGFCRVKTENLYLVFLGPRDSKEYNKLTKLIDSNAIKNVAFVDPVPQNRLIQVTRTADFGVIPYASIDLNTKYCMPNKLFEYVLASLPILANLQLDEVKSVMSNLNNPGKMVDFTNPAEIANGIIQMLNSDLDTFRIELKKSKKFYTWDHEHSKYVQIVSAALNSEI